MSGIVVILGNTLTKNVLNSKETYKILKRQIGNPNCVKIRFKRL